MHVASEMERLQFKTPLLIGGATTSGKHTAVKIAPAYCAGTIHVTDASKAVGVVGELMKPDSVDDYLSKLSQEQETIRAEFRGHSDRKLLPYASAREKRWSIDWLSAEIAQPEFIGTRVLDEVPLAEIIPYIDWTPFFHVWELRGRYPAILEKPEVGETARELFENARALLEEIVEGKLLQARAVYGFLPANSEGDDIVVFANERRETELARFHTPCSAKTPYRPIPLDLQAPSLQAPGMKILLIFTVVLLLNLVVFAWFNRGALVQILALRQQLTVYKRKAKKPRLRNRDRLFWSLLSKV